MPSLGWTWGNLVGRSDDGRKADEGHPGGRTSIEQKNRRDAFSWIGGSGAIHAGGWHAHTWSSNEQEAGLEQRMVLSRCARTLPPFQPRNLTGATIVSISRHTAVRPIASLMHFACVRSPASRSFAVRRMESRRTSTYKREIDSQRDISFLFLIS